jgi:signal transduction histidine kinase
LTALPRLFIAGRRHADREPQAAFEVTLWRALAVFRVVTLAYAIILTAGNFGDYAHPYAAWVVTAVMAAWTLASISAYAIPQLRTWHLLVADLAITAGCVLASRWIVGPEQLGIGIPTLTITWMACPVMAVAIAEGRTWGAVAALAMGSCDLATRGLVTQATLSGTVIMAMAAIAVGHIAGLARQAQQRLRQAAEAEAASRERERLARGIHDSVLQVLALVQRRGAELGGEAAELGRLAGEQEMALRSLVGAGPPGGAAVPTGMVDLRALLSEHAAAGVTLAAPATGVWMRAAVAREIGAAVAAAVENVRRHCPPGVRVWILVEDEAGTVTVTVRDNGPGMQPGRLAEARAQGRLGVAQSIEGRLRDLGGTARVTTAPGAGTEVELTLPTHP